jgi:hypothetical protein
LDAVIIHAIQMLASQFRYAIEQRNFSGLTAEKIALAAE